MATHHIEYLEIEGKSKAYYVLLGLLGVFMAIAWSAAHYMDSQGHHVSGMNNQIVWGVPHIFAIFLIVAASGALNVASIASVFGKTAYKPLAPLSALLAIALLVGGLIILVLDLGRPERFWYPLIYINKKSVFSWNMLLYSVFIGLVAVYLWFMLEKRKSHYSDIVGFFAFLWRLILTTGTGSIFGFLVARQAYDTAVMAPLFVLMSFAFGMAVFILVLLAIYRFSHRSLGDYLLMRLRSLLGIFVSAVFYFVVVYHLTNLYATEHHAVEKFILLEGGIYTALFWLVQIGLGNLAPLVLLYLPKLKKCRLTLTIAALLVLCGAFAQLYVIIIGGQAFPLVLFPGMEVQSSFMDGVVANYTPSVWEFLLGLGGVALALFIVIFGVKILRILPESLDDAVVEAQAEKHT